MHLVPGQWPLLLVDPSSMLASDRHDPADQFNAAVVDEASVSGPQVLYSDTTPDEEQAR